MNLSCLGLNRPLIESVVYFTHTLRILFIPSSISTSAQGLTQNQTCAGACTAAQACDHQCVPGSRNDPYANTDIYVSRLSQSGCLCNVEICLQCCEAAGNNDPDFQSCPFIQLAAGSVLAYCSVVSVPIFPFPSLVRVIIILVKHPAILPFGFYMLARVSLTKSGAREGSTPAKATPAKAYFIYGDGENGSPISTYASNLPFPSSTETFVSASSLISGQADKLRRHPHCFLPPE